MMNRIWIRVDKNTNHTTLILQLEVFAKFNNGRFLVNEKGQELDVREAMSLATKERPLESPYAFYYPQDEVEKV